jgi:sigma-E factor negative regulatory protein RseB
VSERVVEMDGDGAEIVRTSEEVRCIFPRQRKVVVEQRGDKSAEKNPLRASLPSYTAAVDEQYELSIDARERVVGRPAVVIAISPRDDFRYGYRIWLDEATAMPLRTQLIGQDGAMPIEELFFTSIAIDEVIPPQLIETALDTAGYVWVRHRDAVQAKDLGAGDAQWRVTNLPAGFMPTIASLEFMADAVTPRTHLVYSDGLASISVFVDPGVPAHEQVEGVASVGAANAYSVMVDGHLVTAMGEVPARTVQQVATSMRAED